MRIQHNIMAMNAYRNYNNNTSALSKNLEKLSSGYKINRAGDDAAGLAISEKMRAQITGLDAAQKNVKDGISLVKTAEGAMQEVQDMLNRMVYLSNQSANGTYDNEVDRANLQKEVDSLRSEIDRIADSANFNGIQLLDGSLKDGATLGGAPIDLTNSVTHVTVRNNTATAAVKPQFSVDLDGYTIKTDHTGAGNGTLSLEIGGQTLTSGNITLGVDQTINADAIAQAFNAKTVTIGNVTYTAKNDGSKLTFTANIDPKNEADAKADFKVSLGKLTGIGATGVGTINDATQVITAGKPAQTVTQATADFKLSTDMLADGNTIKIGDQEFTINYSSDKTQGTAIGVKDLLDDTGKLDSTKVAEIANRITNAGKANTVFTIGNNGGTLTLQSKTGNTTDLSTEALVRDQISVTPKPMTGSSLTLQIGDSSDSWNQLQVSVEDMHCDALGIADVDISTQDGAQKAVEVIEKAINSVSMTRGTLGATQNRLEHTQNNLSVMTENITDAESTIRDTDVAEEMMSYTKNNILIQSAQAMLAQANQVPQGVLQLLQ